MGPHAKHPAPGCFHSMMASAGHDVPCLHRRTYIACTCAGCVQAPLHLRPLLEACVAAKPFERSRQGYCYVLGVLEELIVVRP